MLNKGEEQILKVIIDNAYEGNTCLISKSALIAFIGNEKLVNENNVENIINGLYANDYIDFILSNQREERVYCITLLKKGKNYNEVKKREFIAIRNKILLAVLGAVVSFIVGRILLLLFR